MCSETRTRSHNGLERGESLERVEEMGSRVRWEKDNGEGERGERK